MVQCIIQKNMAYPQKQDKNSQNQTKSDSVYPKTAQKQPKSDQKQPKSDQNNISCMVRKHLLPPLCHLFVTSFLPLTTSFLNTYLVIQCIIQKNISYPQNRAKTAKIRQKSTVDTPKQRKNSQNQTKNNIALPKKIPKQLKLDKKLQSICETHSVSIRHHATQPLITPSLKLTLMFISTNIPNIKI